MADSKVTDLALATTPLVGTEVVYLVQGGLDVQATAQDIADLGGSSGSGVTTGAAVLDFGAFPGTNEASVTVTGQAAITAANVASAQFRQATTADHTVNDHTYAAMLTQLTCTVPTVGTGFTITARSPEKMQGTFNINWQWA